jgi:hypothetical protein
VPGFTPEEVQEVVDRFLLKQVQVPRLKTGNRDTLYLRDVVFDLLTAALLLRTDSYFYLVWLAKNRVRALVQQQLEAVNRILAWGPGLERPSKQIESTVDLANAQAALLDLNAGLNSRREGVRGGLGPSVDRFRRSVDRFVRSELTKNVVSGGQVVETAEELRERVRLEWVGVRARHEDITERLLGVRDAAQSLSAVRLPESSIRDVVGRIRSRLVELTESLEQPTAVRDSREALLELLAMRTLIAKVSSFQNPRLALMPLSGDPLTGTLVDSPGTEASLVGVVSAPFNYAAGATLPLSINAGASTPTVALLGDSRAELRSAPGISARLAGPSTPATMVVVYDRAGAKAGGITGPFPYPNVGSLVSALNTILSPEVVATHDVAADQIVIHSANPSDVSHLSFSEELPAEANFVTWFFDAYPRVAAGVPVPLERVRESLHQAVPEVLAEEVAEDAGTFRGRRVSAFHHQIAIQLASGTDLVTDGTEAVSSPTVNFEGLGIRPGAGLEITSPLAAAGAYSILEVSGGRLVLDAVVPAGVATYFVGPDFRTLPAGARARIVSAERLENLGYYRTVAPGGVGLLPLDRNLPFSGQQLQVIVSRQQLRLTAKGTTSSSGIGVPTATVGATALGLPVSASEVVAQLSAFQISGGDFLARGVKEGDYLRLTAPSLAAHVVQVTGVRVSELEFSPPVPYEPGAWSFEVVSARYSTFEQLRAGVLAYEAHLFSGEGLRALDTLVGRLLQGGRFGTGVAAQFLAHAQALQSLLTALDAYGVPREVGIDNVVETLREQGLDRALDLLLKLDIEGFFGMKADEVSYNTNLVRKAATAAREITPVSKSGQPTRESWRRVSFQPDPFSMDEG